MKFMYAGRYDHVFARLQLFVPTYLAIFLWLDLVCFLLVKLATGPCALWGMFLDSHTARKAGGACSRLLCINLQPNCV